MGRRHAVPPKHKKYMTTTNQKSYWARLCERLVRSREQGARSKLPERPVMDVDENDRVLAQMPEGDQVHRTLMNYAYTHVENNMAVAFDVARSVDDQRDFKNRAAGVAAFIADVETTRARLRQEIFEKQKLESRKKK